MAKFRHCGGATGSNLKRSEMLGTVQSKHKQMHNMFFDFPTHSHLLHLKEIARK